MRLIKLDFQGAELSLRVEAHHYRHIPLFCFASLTVILRSSLRDGLCDYPWGLSFRAPGRRRSSPGVCSYNRIHWGGADGAWLAVEYEVLRYKTKRGLPLPEGKTLQEAALYGMELLPNYFGAFPVPSLTPWGRTLRHCPLDNGVYWVETEQCVEVLAVCWPIWETELPDGLVAADQRLEQEGGHGCLYFLRQTACTVIFELLQTRPALVNTGLIHRAELMNDVWNYQPRYALSCNVQEQMGLKTPPVCRYAPWGWKSRNRKALWSIWSR